MNQYAYCFSHSTRTLGVTHLTKHYIDTGNAQPIKQRPYRVSPVEREAIAQICEEMLTKGFIEHADSPWSSPVVLVKKPDGKWRFCCDFRKLNAVTRKDSYPLTRINDCLDRLQNSIFTIFSSLDCDQAYYQVPLNEDDKSKTAFVTPDALFQ